MATCGSPRTSLIRNSSHQPIRRDSMKYPVLSPFEQPDNITAGPDGAVWFAAVGGALSTASAGIVEFHPSRGS